MASDLENIRARKTSILTELASIANKPDYSIDGQGVQWSSYRKSLQDELEQLIKLELMLQGPVFKTSRART